MGDGADGGIRAHRAEATRQAVLAAALETLSERGYAATTVVAVAEAAGVTRGTVHALAGPKAALVAALGRDAEDPDGVLGAVAGRVAGGSSDPGQALRLAVAGAGEAVRRRQAVWTYLLDHRHEHPAVAAAAESALSGFRSGIDAVADHLHAGGTLRPELTRARVRQILWFYLGVQSWRTVRGLGWGWDGAARWLGEQAATALLPPPEVSTTTRPAAR